MLFLIFQIGSDAYAIDVQEVQHVLPLVHYKQIPRVPAGLAGLFNYHGTPVPLIDLTELALGRQSELKMSTRIILVNYGRESGEKHLVGLVAERVMETLRWEKAELSDSGPAANGSPYLGAITIDRDRIIQQIDVRRLLPAELEGELFRELVTHGR